MFKPNTVFVVGAAASLDFDFPLGADFKTKIANYLKLEEDKFFSRLAPTKINYLFFQAFGEQHNAALVAAPKISNGLGYASSIDNFLEMRKSDPDIATVGKAVIAQLIFAYEKRASELHTPNFHQPLPPGTRFDGKWLQKFAEICFEGCEEKELKEALERVTFISFNYDRCIEQFTRLAISALYSLDFAEAGKLVDNHLTVLHPYGSLGKLVDLPFPNADYPIPSAVGMATNIKTFTEQVDDEYTLNAIEDELKSAETVVFLGFGYHKQNIDLLRMHQQSRSQRRVLGTAVGLSEDAKSTITKLLEIALAVKTPPKNSNLESQLHPVRLFNQNCTQLIEEQRHSLIDVS